MVIPLLANQDLPLILRVRRVWCKFVLILVRHNRAYKMRSQKRPVNDARGWKH